MNTKNYKEKMRMQFTELPEDARLGLRNLYSIANNHSKLKVDLIDFYMVIVQLSRKLTLEQIGIAYKAKFMKSNYDVKLITARDLYHYLTEPVA